MGKVYLIGGGPGDPGLITVKGLKMIQQADCVIYDRLINPVLLAAAKRNCECIYVGKENHHHTMRQEEINRLLAEKARQYNKVVRLKGGDVYVFGRGGEEGEYLKKHAISFEVIPGISSCIAGLTYAGIPITHRGIAGGFQVITAHNQRDELADIDFRALAGTTNTCIFLMGLSKLPEIMEQYLLAGKPRDTKVAVIAHATLPDQKTVVGEIQNITEKVQQEGLTSPALIVVGDVVSLRSKLNFYEEKPLFGRRFFFPKSGEKESGLSERLREAGAFVKEIAVGRIVLCPEQMEGFCPEKYSWILLTSKNGVDSFIEGLKQNKIDYRRLHRVKFAVIGASTEDYLRQHGFYADFVPEQYDSDTLYEEFRRQLNTQDCIFYGKAAIVENHLYERLRTICQVECCNLYRNEEAENTDAWRQAFCEKYDGLLFTSASAVKRTMKNWKGIADDTGKEYHTLLKRDGKIISIGRKTSEALLENGIHSFEQADIADYDGVFHLCMEAFRKEKEKNPVSYTLKSYEKD